MSRQNQLIALLVGAAVAVAALVGWLTLGDKGWSTADKEAFVSNCVEKCRAAPGVTPDRYPLCDRACACALEEGQKQMSGPELGAAAEAINSNTATPLQREKMSRIQSAAMACAMPPKP